MMKPVDLIIENKELFKNYFLDDNYESLEYFPKFNVINILIGANNSGKSRFMRNLMNTEKICCYSNYNDLKKKINLYNHQVEKINSEISTNIASFEKGKISKFYGNFITRTDIVKLKDNKLQYLTINKLNQIKEILFENIGLLERFKRYKVFELVNFENIEKEYIFFFENIKRYYIPTLRTAHSLFENGNEENVKKIEQDIYQKTLKKVYDINDDVEIFTGMHLYKRILNARNSKREVRESFENFENFISNNFFNGKRIDIVAEFNKDENLNGDNNSEIISVHIDGENETRKLYELGDGIQAIIILMYQIYMADNNSYIFIDEPELNLHPGMQRLFLEQISLNEYLKNKKLTYIISTHSNHFLDLTIEKETVSIYSFTPKMLSNGEKRFVIKNVNSGDNETLKILGVNNSSVFLANCSIWVEGISDRNYIKAFLKSYVEYLNKTKGENIILKEDIDFAFFEYSGSNIDHYLFENDFENNDSEIIISNIKSFSLSNKIFLLADSDATTKKNNKSKYDRLKKIEKLKGNNFTPKIFWKIREIENLLTNEIWKNVLIHFCNEKLLPKYKNEIQIKINKALDSIKSENYRLEYIGEFLNEIRNHIDKINKTYILNQSFYETKVNSKYGTIINKRKLSELVFEKNFQWEELSKNNEIKKLTIEIFNFINKKQ